MTVLIKGMLLPPTCSNCPMCREDDLGFTYSYCTGKFEEIDGYGLNRRMDFCPMVDVPTPHGRLIEEPKELNYSGLAYIHHLDFQGIAEYFAEQIRTLPTVIESEE